MAMRINLRHNIKTSLLFFCILIVGFICVVTSYKIGKVSSALNSLVIVAPVLSDMERNEPSYLRLYLLYKSCKNVIQDGGVGFNGLVVNKFIYKFKYKQLEIYYDLEE